MDRQAHDFAAAMAFAQQQQQANIQQQQQLGFHPQQFPPQVHGPPFMPPHASMQQQFGFHRLPPQQQLHPLGPHPHPPPHATLLHLQQQQHPPAAFPPHLPPHLTPPPFLNPFDQPPPPAAPPSDPELHKRIDKLVEYILKNGPEFEAMIREKQQDNPAYSFLFGADGHNYYRYKLWLSTRAHGPAFNPSFPPIIPPIPNPNPLNPPSVNVAGGLPPIHQSPFPPYYDQQQHPQQFMVQPRPDYESPVKPFKGLNGPLPSDVAAELSGVLNNLNGTKESIKGAKSWFMQRSPFAPALAESLRDRVFALEDSERQLHIIYLANDILFDSLQRRANARDLDNEALAFKPVLGPMLARIYHNPHNKDANQSRLQKILQFWATKEVYDPDTIYALEDEMVAGQSTNVLSGLSKDAATTAEASALQQPTSSGNSKWSSDKQKNPVSASLDQDLKDKQMGLSTSLPSIPASQLVPPVTQPFLASQQPPGVYPAVPPVPYGASVPMSHSVPAPSVVPTSTSNIGEKPPPYPLFPPGLIPGMVRKMQIGSGVPYSPMSPLDIPTVIPPSTIPPSDILERVSKFFKEIGEVNPSEGPMQSSGSAGEDDDYEREQPVRKGGACIPPPSTLMVDPETGTYPDGSVERKPGSSGSGRLGLGATANPNEVSQYDDVYTSYRKQRSTSYHSSMSARAAAR